MKQPKKAIFIMSLDCEGKWGMMDHLNNDLNRTLTNDNINKVYVHLTQLLDTYNVKATFAFVAAFTMSLAEYKNKQADFKEVLIEGKVWNQPFFTDIKNDHYEGWLNPTALELVLKKGHHEIATHGFTHLPLSESMIDLDDFIFEIETSKMIMKDKGIDIKTLVYPRNLVGYSENLSALGITGYREQLFYTGPSSVKKAKSLLSELNPFQKSQPHNASIPAGYFLNWRCGLRKKVPITVSVKRWQSIINDAINNDKVVHLWTHPHNFITGDRQFELLERILHIVDKAQNEERISVMTQKEYCEHITLSKTKALPL